MVEEVRVTAGELAVRAAAGDAAAWHGLVARYNGLLWSVARSCGLDAHTAEDAVQTTWLRLSQHIQGLRDPEAVGGWLVTVCRNECRSSPNVPFPRSPLDGPDLPDAAPGPAEILIGRDRVARVAAALASLSERCRVILRLLANAATYGDVAVALNVPAGSVGPARLRCLARLREALGE